MSAEKIKSRVRLMTNQGSCHTAFPVELDVINATSKGVSVAVYSSAIVEMMSQYLRKGLRPGVRVYRRPFEWTRS